MKGLRRKKEKKTPNRMTGCSGPPSVGEAREMSREQRSPRGSWGSNELMILELLPKHQRKLAAHAVSWGWTFERWNNLGDVQCGPMLGMKVTECLRVESLGDTKSRARGDNDKCKSYKEPWNIKMETEFLTGFPSLVMEVGAVLLKSWWSRSSLETICKWADKSGRLS